MILPNYSTSFPFITPPVLASASSDAHMRKAEKTIAPPLALHKVITEQNIKKEEKRRPREGWDPATHPSYDLINPKSAQQDSDELSMLNKELESLFNRLSLNHYSGYQGKSYVIRFRLPRQLLNSIRINQQMHKRRVVIKYYYHHSTIPNIPSDVLYIL